jgi:dynein heavy chain, axonemal
LLDENSILESAKRILNILPKQFDMAIAKDKFSKGEEDALQLIFIQDLTRYNELLDIMSSSLEKLISAINGIFADQHVTNYEYLWAGLSKMHTALEMIALDLTANRIPVLWKLKSFLSVKPLDGFIENLQERLSFLQVWKWIKTKS